MKIFLILIISCFALFAKTIELKNFEVDVYTKNNSDMKKITMDLEILANDNTNESALKDAINVITSSFYKEDLLSSKGKEAFKESIKKYALSKHKITIHSIFIITLKEANIDIEKIAKLLEEHYKKQNSVNKDFNAPEQNIQQKAQQEWERIGHEFTIPYYPHVSIGWDNSPRTARSAVVKNNTPENFQNALTQAEQYLDNHPKLHPLVTINSWNEWTETSYLQPDDVNGYGYLDAVRKVFMEESK